MVAWFAAAALLVGLPASLREARPVDFGPQPLPSVAGFPQQDWQLFVVDPATHRIIRVGVEYLRNGGAWEWSAGLGYYARLPALAAVGAQGGMGGAASATSLSMTGASIAKTSRGWKVDFDEQGARLHLRLSAARAGVTATSWPVGGGQFGWSVLAGTARADGTLDAGNVHLAIRGWRAALDHTWESDTENNAMIHHDSAFVEGSRGGWLVEGFEQGQGSAPMTPVDAHWQGVLVHVGPRGASFCRPRVVREGWRQGSGLGLDAYVYPHTMTATCGGLRLSLVRGAADVAGEAVMHGVTDEAVTGGGGFGMWREEAGVP